MTYQMCSRLLLLICFWQISSVLGEVLSESVCIQGTPHSKFPLVHYNRTHPAANEAVWFQQPLYLGAIYPPAAAPVSARNPGKHLVGERMTVVLVQHRDKEGGLPSSPCSAAAREKAANIVKQLVDGKHVITPSIFAKQSKLFANLVVYGRQQGESEKAEAFYRMLKMDSHYIAEIPATLIDAEDPAFNFYWFQFSPPLPAVYSLTVDIDLANCKASLQDPQVGITNLKNWKQRSSEALAVTEGDKYCDLVLARGTVKLTVDVGGDALSYANHKLPGNSADKAKLIKETAALFRSGTGVGAACDLTDLSGSYWIYPPTAMTVPLEKMLQHSIPRFHNPKCPSFYPRLRNAKGNFGLCMIGDSNSKRTCLHQQTESPLINNGLHVNCPQFEHKTTYLDSSSSEEGKATDFNKAGFLKRANTCLASPHAMIAINVGHHTTELTGHELKNLVLLPTKQAIDQKLKERKKPENRVVVVWATLASHLRDFVATANEEKWEGLKHPKTLLIRSNSYREVVDNEEIMLAYTDRTKRGGFGDVNSDYMSIIAAHKNNNSTTRSSDLYSFLDTFHVTLALGSVSHAYGDPVHFNSEYFHLHGFLVHMMVVSGACHHETDGSCVTGSLTGSNVDFEYLLWNPVPGLSSFRERAQKWPSGVDYKQLASVYIY